jgi:hypothetical protein
LAERWEIVLVYIAEETQIGMIPMKGNYALENLIIKIYCMHVWHEI